jgi:hypothetical protein
MARSGGYAELFTLQARGVARRFRHAQQSSPRRRQQPCEQRRDAARLRTHGDRLTVALAGYQGAECG